MSRIRGRNRTEAAKQSETSSIYTCLAILQIFLIGIRQAKEKEKREQFADMHSRIPG